MNRQLVQLLMLFALAIVFVLLLIIVVRAQVPDVTACTPVLLCPQPAASGTGGRGGAGGRGGSGGVAVSGTGGRGGSGGTGGSLPAGSLTVTAALELDRRVVRAGSVLAGSVTYKNTSSAAVVVPEIRIATRGPGATHEGGPFTDLSPALTNVPLAAGESVRLQATRTFSADSPTGRWEAYSTHKDSAGAWHDEPSVYFQMVRSDQPTPTPPTGKMSVGVQEWFVAPWAGTAIYKANVNWATAYAAGDDIWNPQFIAELQGFVVFRHMDTNAVNWSKIRHWSQRKQANDPRNQEVYIDGASPADTTGMAIEWQIDLCNRAGIDCWFTHPYLADDDYLRQQAQLIQAKLDPQLRAYIELSNEVWNGSFSAFQQAIDAGVAAGLPGSNQYYQGIAHEMYRALQMFEVYQGVFGAGAMGTRVIRVFSESGNLDLTTEALRNIYESGQWNPRAQKIDMVALAPYIGNGVNGASETLSRWKSEVDQKVAGEPIAIALEQHVRAYQIPMLGCYEAGMHHLSNADAWARHEDAYDAYVYMLDRFATKMNAPCSLYTLHGTWEPKGAWGLFNAVGQQLAQAPKARGTKEWIAGTAVRPTTCATRVLVAIVVWVLIALAIGLWAHLRGRPSRRRPTPPSPPAPPAPPSPPPAQK